MRAGASIDAVATAVPEHRVPQSAMRARAEEVLSALDPSLLRYLTVFDNAGVSTRHFVHPIDWYLEERGWAERTREFLDAGLSLAERASRDALSGSDLRPEDVDGVVFVTSTGIAAPSLDARLANRLDLRPDIVRAPLWGLGCAGGVAGLARAADLASARPAGRFLVVSLELCSLAFMRSELSPKMVVAATLFGDGCAAAVVSGPAARGSGPRILAAASHQWRDTEWVMGWDVLDEGLGVVFSTEIPAFVSREIRPVVLEFLKSSRADRPRMLLHPGGAKVLASYRAALDLSEADLADSASVLREYGNMSSPTVLFVLERALSRGALRDGERALLGALGPGFASELALLEG